MNKPFFINNQSVLTFDQLLTSIEEANTYYPCLKTKNLFDHWINFIKALIFNKPITLIDSDLQDSELAALKLDDLINIEVECPKLSIYTFSELLDLIRKSSSEIIIFTSGTTGQPKNVIHSVQSLTRSIKVSEKHRSNLWGFAFNPTHMAGIQVFFQALFNENTMVNVFGLSKDEIYTTIEIQKITHISATPTFYRLLIPPNFPLQMVERVTLGGEKASANLITNIKSIFTNAKITNIYASTEAGSLFVSDGEFFSIPDNIKSQIKFDKDEILIHESLLGKSDSLVTDNGYYRTGDLIEWVGEHGMKFRFKSRINELINIGGYKVNPNEVEEAILSFPEVAAVNVFGKQNSVLGNILCANIQLKKEQIISENTLRLELKKSLQEFKIPRRIIFVDQIELTRTGKTKRL